MNKSRHTHSIIRRENLELMSPCYWKAQLRFVFAYSRPKEVTGQTLEPLRVTNIINNDQKALSKSPKAEINDIHLYRGFSSNCRIKNLCFRSYCSEFLKQPACSHESEVFGGFQRLLQMVLPSLSEHFSNYINLPENIFFFQTISASEVKNRFK